MKNSNKRTIISYVSNNADIGIKYFFFLEQGKETILAARTETQWYILI